MREFFGMARHIDALQIIKRDFPPFGADVSAQAEGDIVDDVQVRKQREILKHQAHAALFRRQMRICVGNDRAINQDPPTVLALHAGGYSQRRRLAAARRTQQADDFACANLQGHSLHSDMRRMGSIAFPERVQHEARHAMIPLN